MSTFIQLPGDPRDPEGARLQRRRFHEHVTARAEPARDRVILIEPNPALAGALQHLWAAWPRAEVVNAAVTTDDEPTTTYYRAVEDAPDFSWMGRDRAVVLRRFPNARIEPVEVPALTPGRVLTEMIGRSEGSLLAVDAGTGLLAGVANLPALDHVDSIVVGLNAVTRREDVQDDLTSLSAVGFTLAGRAWGEAGESVLLARPGSSSERLQGTFAEARVRLGDLIVRGRDQWVGPAQRQAVATRITARIRRDLRPADILDPAAGHALAQVTRAEVERALDVIDDSTVTEWTAPEPLGEDPWTLSRECHERHGVWPLSFSYPGRPLPIVDDPENLVSPITPGLPYSFTSEAEYLATYANAYWGLTHRKAGWDCFRHLEIMASGALPWMLDAAEIPRYSMVHYPKAAMAAASKALRMGARRPDESTRQAFREHLETNLASKAMARYLLQASGLEGAQTVLFVDGQLPHHADYQSVLTLIGMKQLLGSGCRVMHPVDYIYEDTDTDVSTLYGRGFGYTRVVPSSARGANEQVGEGAVETALDDFDVVVVGSVTRNSDAAAGMLEAFPAHRTVWIHGEDLPPTVDEVARYRRSKVHMFVRSIHVSR